MFGSVNPLLGRSTAIHWFLPYGSRNLLVARPSDGAVISIGTYSREELEAIPDTRAWMADVVLALEALGPISSDPFHGNA